MVLTYPRTVAFVRFSILLNSRRQSRAAISAEPVVLVFYSPRICLNAALARSAIWGSSWLVKSLRT